MKTLTALGNGGAFDVGLHRKEWTYTTGAHENDAIQILQLLYSAYDLFTTYRHTRYLVPGMWVSCRWDQHAYSNIRNRIHHLFYRHTKYLV